MAKQGAVLMAAVTFSIVGLAGCLGEATGACDDADDDREVVQGADLVVESRPNGNQSGPQTYGAPPREFEEPAGPAFPTAGIDEGECA